MNSAAVVLYYMHMHYKGGRTRTEKQIVEGLIAAPRRGPRARTRAGAVCTRSAWLGATACTTAAILFSVALLRTIPMTEASALWQARGSQIRSSVGGVRHLPPYQAGGCKHMGKAAAADERALEVRAFTFTNGLERVRELQVHEPRASKEGAFANVLERDRELQVHDAGATFEGAVFDGPWRGGDHRYTIPVQPQKAWTPMTCSMARRCMTTMPVRAI